MFPSLLAVITCGITVVPAVGPRPHLCVRAHAYVVPLVSFQSTNVLRQGLLSAQVRLCDAILFVQDNLVLGDFSIAVLSTGNRP